MGYSADSVRYLHIAYTVFIIVQIAYAAWLAARWNRVQSATRNIDRTNG